MEYGRLTAMENIVKFIDKARGIVEGWAIPYGGPLRGRDFYGTAFTEDTNLHDDWFARGRPLLYDHGFDISLGSNPIGRQVKATREELGVWAQVQLDRAHEYAEVIADLVEQGIMGFSSGSIGHLVDIAKNGEIREWPWIELSLTPTPANPFAMIRPTQAGDMLRAFEALDLPVSDEAKEALSKFSVSVPDIRSLIEANKNDPPPEDPPPDEEEDDEEEEHDHTLPVRGVALGRLIKHLRDEAGLSNAGLAKAVGVSPATMRQVITGRIVCPPYARLEALAKVLKVKVDRLVGAAESDGCSRYEEENRSVSDELRERLAAVEAIVLPSEPPAPSDGGSDEDEAVTRALLEADEHLKGLLK